jgi:hypothetical protein
MSALAMTVVSVMERDYRARAQTGCQRVLSELVRNGRCLAGFCQSLIELGGFRTLVGGTGLRLLDGAAAFSRWAAMPVEGFHLVVFGIDDQGEGD